MSQQWMSIIEYSRNFNVSDMTVRRRIKNGRLQAALKDGKYFIPVDADHQPEIDDEHSFDIDARSAKFQSQTKRQLQYPMNTQRSSLSHESQSGHQLRRKDQSTKSNERDFATLPRQPMISDLIEQKNQDSRQFSKVAIPQPKRIAVPTPLIDQKIVEDLKEEKPIEVSSCDLLEFANKAIEIAEGKSKAIELEWQSKVKTLDTEIALRDKRIEVLRQEVEDLQLLIKVLETNKP